MNFTENIALTSRNEKRGTLTRKLLQAAKRRRATQPTMPLPSDKEQPSQNKSAKVLGPYPNGGKWRLVVKEGSQRKSIVCDTEQAALTVRAQLLAPSTTWPVGQSQKR